MDSKIDFSTYTLEELYSSAASIDRELYPERAKLIDDLILQKQQDPDNQEAPIIDGDLATRGHRLAAAIVDALIAIIVTLPMLLYVGLDKFEDPTLEVMAISFIYGIALVLVLHGYFLYTYGQTIGKRYMGIRIENLDGTKAELSKIFFMRMLPIQLISIIPLVGQSIAGFVNPLFIFGKEKRCLHDYIAKTKVCYVADEEEFKEETETVK
jgi:uncharacterized RDD family membrane protein YckC